MRTPRAILLLAVVAVSCAPAPFAPAVDPLAGTYSGGGGGGALAAVQALTTRFSQLHPGVRFDLQNLSSDIGVDLASKGQLDFGFVSRDLKPDEKSKVASLSVGAVGSALAVHASNPVKNVSRDAARKLLAGEIRDWGVLGGTAGHAPLIIIREPEAATRTVLEAYLFTGKPAYSKDAIIATSLDQTTQTLHTNADGVAMLTVSKATLGDPQVRLLGFDGVLPTLDTLADGTYPVRRPLFIVHDPDASKLRPAVRAFLEFVKSAEGQRIIASS